MTNQEENRTSAEPDPLDETADGADEGTGDTIDDVSEQLRLDIQMGHVDADVVDVLEERLRKAGIDVRPEEIDDLAEEIENDASR